MVLEILINWMVGLISSLGYPGLFLLSAIESANIPIPSEVIVPFSGYLAWVGRFSFWAVVATAGLGNLFGSLVSYWIGLKGGRPFVHKYGKYLFIHDSHLEKAERWFARWGNAAIFLSRLLPAVRTFISLPAGIAKMDLKKFTIYTLVGSLIWSTVLAAAGFQLGSNWDTLMGLFREFDILIIAAGVIIVVVWKFRKKIFKRTSVSSTAVSATAAV
jgi:membrane protein DedA with SNARE-associated domain